MRRIIKHVFEFSLVIYEFTVMWFHILVILHQAHVLVDFMQASSEFREVAGIGREGQDVMGEYAD